MQSASYERIAWQAEEVTAEWLALPIREVSRSDLDRRPAVPTYFSCLS
jgi:hypothetical protein